MKITEKRGDTCIFENLPAGMVFRFMDNVYMKMEDVRNIVVMYNAVGLSTGKAVLFERDATVEVCDAEVVIHLSSMPSGKED